MANWSIRTREPQRPDETDEQFRERDRLFWLQAEADMAVLEEQRAAHAKLGLKPVRTKDVITRGLKL